ncbi:MAG: 1-acyl-sn-glycerol-3-phosphate acyltransferase [Alphaproteobacteria bacterium]|nr:1-acyl-sn-glycerol-3-phosphate acyltransferase [Alphaproteobacteria bacterium]
MPISKLSAFLRLSIYAAFTIPLMPVQAVLVWLDSPWADRLPHWYHRRCCRIFGFDVVVRGTPSADRPTLFVANHVSYLDITVFSALIPVSFVAKREVAAWPFFGWLARLQRTVFVGRERRNVHGERDELGNALARGRNLMLFPEATSWDGTRIKPFKSSLLSVAEIAPEGRPLTVQPMTIAYTRVDGMPIGRSHRPFFAWYGDMELVEHLWQAMGIGRTTVVVEFHEPVTFARFGSRKALTQHCEQVIGTALSEINAGRRAA